MPAALPGIAALFQRVILSALFVLPALVWSDIVPERFMLPKLATGEVLLMAAIAIYPFLAPGLRLHLRAREFVAVILGAGVLNALLAVAQAAGISPWDTTRAGRHAVYGAFGNPAMLAEFLAPVAILGFGTAVAGRTGMGRWAAGFSTALFLLAIALTETRSAWIGLVAGLIVLAMLAGEVRLRRIALAALVIPVVVVVAWSPLRSRVALGLSGGDPGVATRTFMWEVAVEMAREHPAFGVGFGGYASNYLDYAAKVQESGRGRPMYAGTTAHAHSDPLQLLAEAGLVGGAVALLLLAWIGWLAVRGIRALAGDERVFRAVGVAIASAILVESVTAFPFRSFPTFCLFLWSLAAAVPLPDPAGRKLTALAGWVSAAVVLLAVPALFTGPFLAEAYVLAGAAGPDRAAILERGLMLAPGHGELRFRLGIARMGEGRLDEAAAEFERALPRYPDPDVRFNLGYIALQKKDYAGAEEWFREGLRRYPYFKAPAWADYAVALAGLGRRDEARAAAERALGIDPGLGRARVFLAEMEKRGGKR